MIMEYIRRCLGFLSHHGRAAFIIAAGCVVVFFLITSDRLIDDLARQERERMEIWADATKEIVASAVTNADDSGASSINTDIDFLLSIIERNTTIPVLLTDDHGNILQFRNFNLPEAVEDPLALSPRNEKFLKEKFKDLSSGTNVIDIAIAPGLDQHLYYEDSTLLKRLSYYPYIQLAVMIAFIAIVYFGVLSSKKAEQNKVWVGLSKETAHQLGTPISSLMAWIELLPDLGVDAETVGEMDKDVKRLSTIASRFSKIGSVPQMVPADINGIVDKASAYMSTRISGHISFTTRPCDAEIYSLACEPLFEWVMENLIKNAVDAMEGNGAITVTTISEKDCNAIEVADTGKGIARKNFNNVFKPGYTTKKRGWGLGLTLAKRIIEEYHRGRIFVKHSAPGQGTTFRIELPKA